MQHVYKVTLNGGLIFRITAPSFEQAYQLTKKHILKKYDWLTTDHRALRSIEYENNVEATS